MAFLVFMRKHTAEWGYPIAIFSTCIQWLLPFECGQRACIPRKNVNVKHFLIIYIYAGYAVPFFIASEYSHSRHPPRINDELLPFPQVVCVAKLNSSESNFGWDHHTNFTGQRKCIQWSINRSTFNAGMLLRCTLHNNYRGPYILILLFSAHSFHCGFAVFIKPNTTAACSQNGLVWRLFHGCVGSNEQIKWGGKCRLQ